MINAFMLETGKTIKIGDKLLKDMTDTEIQTWGANFGLSQENIDAHVELKNAIQE